MRWYFAFMPYTGKKNVVAVIPARGGSRGIPKKNVRLLHGKPLIAYMICAAKAVHIVERVIVSSDDDEICAVGTAFGAEIIRRPAEISGPSASSEEALLHALSKVEDGGRYVVDILLFLQCTSPLTTSADIEGTLNLLISNEADSAFSASSFQHFLWELDDCGNAVGINHDKRFRAMRQGRPLQFLESGGVYAMVAHGFKKHRHRFFGKTAIYQVPSSRCLEIDDFSDLTKAEAALSVIPQ